MKLHVQISIFFQHFKDSLFILALKLRFKSFLILKTAVETIISPQNQFSVKSLVFTLLHCNSEVHIPPIMMDYLSFHCFQVQNTKPFWRLGVDWDPLKHTHVWVLNPAQSKEGSCHLTPTLRNAPSTVRSATSESTQSCS